MTEQIFEAKLRRGIVKQHELIHLISHMYLAAAMAVEGLSIVALVIGLLFGLWSLVGVWRDSDK